MIDYKQFLVGTNMVYFRGGHKHTARSIDFSEFDENLTYVGRGISNPERWDVMTVTDGNTGEVLYNRDWPVNQYEVDLL